MNILVDILVESLVVDGIEQPIYTDFRNCLSTMLAFEDMTLTIQEKYEVLLRNLYVDLVPEDITPDTLEQALWFLNAGAEDDEKEDDKKNLRLFSFSQDANLIYAAFKQTHQVDLQTVKNLHWWSFLAMFMDLGAETAFCNLVALRKRVKTGKADKYERAVAKEMGKAFEVPDTTLMTLEDRVARNKFFDLVKQGEANRKETA